MGIDYKFSYHGTKQISNALSIPALDEQLRKLEKFDEIFQEEMVPAVERALAISSAHAKDLAPVRTGELRQSINVKMLRSLKNGAVRGSVRAFGIKAFVQEVGRWYGNSWSAKGRWKWQKETGKGIFYLYYGVIERSREITALYAAANERIVNKLVVKG